MKSCVSLFWQRIRKNTRSILLFPFSLILQLKHHHFFRLNQLSMDDIFPFYVSYISNKTFVRLNNLDALFHYSKNFVHVIYSAIDSQYHVHLCNISIANMEKTDGKLHLRRTTHGLIWNIIRCGMIYRGCMQYVYTRDRGNFEQINSLWIGYSIISTTVLQKFLLFLMLYQITQ